MKKIALILFGFLLLGLLEIILRIAIPATRLNLLESVLTICEEDNDFIWKQRENINTIFQGKEVSTNNLGLRNNSIPKEKSSGTFRIICLGASSTFGWGVERTEAYPAVLETMLNKTLSPKKIEVINAGQIGYTTYQGKKFFKDRLVDYKPDAVTIEYLLNDVDQCRFFRNDGRRDSQTPRLPAAALELRKWMTQSRIYLCLQRIIGNFKQKNTAYAAAILKNRFTLSTIRVTQKEYEKNISEIIEFCISRGISVVLIKMPVNLSLPILNETEKDFINNQFSLSAYYFNIACEYEKNCDFDTASVFYKKSLDYQVLECTKAGKLYQQSMKKTAEHYAVPMVDADTAFRNASNGAQLFNLPRDAIHPSPRGHRIIAEFVYGKLAEIINRKNLSKNSHERKN